MEFSGRLATIQFGDVLQLAHQERWTGALVVRRAHREKRIFLDDGKVVGCLSDDPGEYYGRFLLLRGVLDEPQVARALAWRNLSLPEVLADLGRHGDAGRLLAALLEDGHEGVNRDGRGGFETSDQ